MIERKIKRYFWTAVGMTYLFTGQLAIILDHLGDKLPVSPANVFLAITAVVVAIACALRADTLEKRLARWKEAHK